MTEAVTEHVKVRLEEGLYQIPSPDPVSDFLTAHPLLARLLTEARPVIEHYFPAAPVYLEVFADPETPEWVQLLAVISPCTIPETALQQFEQFEQAWWATASERAAGDLVIMLEYR